MLKSVRVFALFVSLLFGAQQVYLRSPLAGRL